jgi:cytidylate kinase
VVERVASGPSVGGGDPAPPRVVAIDGPAAAGKSTIARRLADAIGWAHLDTGALYRAVTREALRRGIDPADGDALADLARSMDLALDERGGVRVDGREVTGEIRTPAVDLAVSRVAAVPGVRRAMVVHQRRFAERHRRIVAEGRDLTTVVFPDASVKIYLDATPEVRAERRRAEGGGEPGEVVRARIEGRDGTDRARAEAPLRRAPEAWYLDTTGLTLEQVFDRVRSHVTSRVRLDGG